MIQNGRSTLACQDSQEAVGRGVDGRQRAGQLRLQCSERTPLSDAVEPIRSRLIPWLFLSIPLPNRIPTRGL